MKMIIGFYRKCDLLTMCGMVISFVGMLLAIHGHFTYAALCLLISGICDGFDGTLARKKKYSENEKTYGIQLDSLSDLVCFGVFPAILTCLISDNIYAYIIAGIYLLCGLVRLAYFNTLAADPKSKKNVFIGVPITTVSIVYPLILFIFRFINYDFLEILLPLLLLMLGILFILRIEIKKVNLVSFIKMFK